VRAPNVRVVLAGLAAAVVLFGGSIATRDGPLGGTDGAGDGAQSASSAQVTAPTASLAGLGSLADRLARLPAVAPGELAGVLYTAGCPPATLDLDTLETATPPGEVCAAPGARFGVRLSDLEETDRELSVVDLNGRPVETVLAPDGWDVFGLARQGIVFCRADERPGGRLRRFGGGTVRLPSCPLARTRAGLLLYPGADGRSVIDERGRRVAAVARPVKAGVSGVREFGDGLLAVDHELYRDGRRIASYDEAITVFSASRDGKVALLHGTDGSEVRLFVYHHGDLHVLDGELIQGGPGVVAPDGQRILVQPDSTTMIEIDPATLRPLARLETVDLVVDWRSAVVEPA
jgi:hypothetical protein